MGYYSDVEMGFGFIFPTYPRGAVELLADIFSVAAEDDALDARLEAMGFDQVQVHSIGDSRMEMDFAFLAKGTLRALTAATAGHAKPEVDQRAMEQLQKVQEMLLARKAKNVSKIEWQTMESIY